MSALSEQNKNAGLGSDTSMSNDPLKICAIGASAGGLSPVEEFFDAMSNDSGVAFVVVQHLSPDHESMMVQLLTSHTEMPVKQATDNMPLQPNHVYLIPPGGELTVHDGRLRLRKRDTDKRHLHRPIDVFFVSMAREYTSQAVAVILSGTGSDGTAGIEQVARAGGLALVQDSSAAFEGMPDAAVRSGFVDAVLSPSEIAQAVRDFASDTAQHIVAAAGDALGPVEALIMAELEKNTGINFSEYKPGTLQRRLERRVQMSNGPIESYAEQLRRDQKEREDLVHELLIDVTNFFRDQAMYDLLAAETLPQLVASAIEESKPLRVWTPGCATGEEPYSMAILLLEEAQEQGAESLQIQIFATDLHTGALAHASAGKYNEEQMANVSYARRLAFFERNDEGWQVRPEVRNLVTFAEHNLLTDAPFTRVDLVTCRNLLIYFRRPAQDRAIGSMAFALRVGGTLVLGPSESLGIAEPDFSVKDATWRIWEKTGDAVRRAYRSTLNPQRRPAALKRVPPYSADQKLLRAYDTVLESQFAGGLLINESRELVHTIGHAANWLRQPSGRPTIDALGMVGDQNLRLTLSAALREMEQGALESRPRQIVGETDVAGAQGDQTQAMFMLCGRRVKVGTEQFYVLYTHPLDVPMPAAEAIATTPMPAGQASYVDQLEAELAYIHESLQSSIEEQETSNEELNAANEELIASNEELQSTNEELSSVNEELRTLNDEHRRQLDQVLDLSADLEQLMSSTEIGVIFLAEDRTVRRFNEPARDYFRVRESDVGRPFEDIMCLLDAPELDTDIDEAFSTGEGKVRPVKARDQTNRHLLVQVDRYELPRRRWGVFVAIVDISEITIADQEKMLATYLRAAPVSVSVWDPENVCLYANELTTRETEIENLAGLTPPELFGPERAAEIIAENKRAVDKTFTMTRPLGESGDDYVISKFPVQIDERTHVGSLAIPVDHVQGLDDLIKDRETLHGLIGAGIISTWDLDETLANAPKVSKAPSTLRVIDKTSGEPCWMQAQEVQIGDSTIIAAVNVNAHHDQLVHAQDEIARLEMELADVRATGETRSADLAERNQDLDNFAHVAAHDLKAPIRSVRSFGELALEEIPAGSPAHGYLNQVIDASKRMTDLVESLLDFASIDREPAGREIIDLRNMIGDVELDLRSEIESSGAEVTILNDLSPILANTEGLRQVLSNLIGNAIKYRGAEHPRVEISSTVDDDGFTIVVADNGIGFDQIHATKMFEPFQRLHPTSVSGSGVGLAICKRIVQRHHGRIWATSSLGEGSRFSVWLPNNVDDLAEDMLLEPGPGRSTSHGES